MKKLSVFFLLLMALTIILSSCKPGNEKNDPTGESGAEGSETIEGQDPEDDEQNGEEPEVDESGNVISGSGGKKDEGYSETTKKFLQKMNFNGAKITILRDWGAYTAGQNEAHDKWIARVAEIEKQFNVDIIESKWPLKPMDDMKSASDTKTFPNGHLYQVKMDQVWNLVKADYLTNLNSAMTTTGVDMKSATYHGFSVAMCNINGGQYAIGIEEVYNSGSLAYNKALVDVDVQALIKNGEWSWEKFEATVKQVQAKHPTKTPFDVNSVSNLLDALAVSNGSSTIGVNSSGKLVSNLGTPAVQDCLYQIQKWFRTDKIIKSEANETSDIKSTRFANGESGFYLYHDVLGSAAKKMGENGYGLAYLPYGPKANKEHYGYWEPAYPYVIPKQYEKQSPMLLLLVDSLYKLEEGKTKNDHFMTIYGRSIAGKSNYELYLSMARNLKFGFNSPIALSDGAKSIGERVPNLWQAQDGNPVMEVGQFVEKYKTSYEKYLNDNWNSITFTGKLQNRY